jgi:K+-sensing histidine kinase KdpD
MSTEPPDFERMREQLQAKVFSSVAHDLKTPLACIIGSLQTLDQMKEKLSPEQHDMLIKTALTEAHRLDILFATMLDKAKPE